MTMIPYGSNGKMKGSWIVTDLIGENLITVPSDGLVYDGRKHRITRLDFSENVREYRDAAENFGSCAENFLRFFAYAEQETELRLPAGTMPAEVFERTDEDFTGICFLKLFADGFLTLRTDENCRVLSFTETGRQYESVLADRLPVLSDVILSYSGDDDEEILIENTQTQLEISETEAEERFPEEERRTEPEVSQADAEIMTLSSADDLTVDYADEPEEEQTKLSFAEAEIPEDTFQVSYDTEEDSALFSDLQGLTQNQVLDLYGMEQQDERVLHIKNSIRSTLTSLKKMMDDIDDEGNAKRSGLQQYRPEFGRKRLLVRDGYSIRIPDDFAVREDTDGYDFIIWLPNDDNPEEWEASLFVILPEGSSAERFFEGRILTEETAEGNTEHHVYLNTDRAVFCFRVSTPVSRDELTELLEILFTEEAMNV